MRPVDADALLKAIDEERQYLLARGQAGAEHILVHNFRNLVEDAPSIPLPDFKDGYHQAIINGQANYSRPRGKWTDLSTDGRHTGWIKCSVCGQEPPNESNLRTDFCPNCGADMRGEE